jgi:hypothetical protein
MTESLPSRFDILLPLDHDFSVILFALNHTPSTFDLQPYTFLFPVTSIEHLFAKKVAIELPGTSDKGPVSSNSDINHPG